MTTAVEVERLTLDESEHLAECETIIEAGLASFVEVGEALAQVRDSRLYRADHATFEDYCRTRWGLVRSRAYQLIDAASVSNMLDTPPANARQAAELAPLRDDPEAMADAWTKANEAAEAEGRPVTARHVRDAVRGPQPPTGVDPDTGEIAPDTPGAPPPVENSGDAPEPDPAPGSGATTTVRETRTVTTGPTPTAEEQHEADLREADARDARAIQRVVDNFPALLALTTGTRRERIADQLVWTDHEALRDRILPHLAPHIANQIRPLLTKETP